MDKLNRSSIPFIARHTKVLVRADFKVSVLAILDNEKVKQTPPEKYTVVAIGDKVENLELNDQVVLSSTSYPQLINFTWNNQSLEFKQKLQKENKAIIGNPNINFSEYFLVDNIDVVGVIPVAQDTLC